ncbi:MAG: DDE transposase family protein [Flavobacteriales bacterium]|nr:MAG: DDE transposase family protein [Flavobacteriales bacterium]
MAQNKLTIQQKKEWAQLLFVKEGITVQKELAKRVDVTEKTIGNWLADGVWKKLRESTVLTREVLLIDLHAQWTELNNSIKKKPAGERFPSSSEADILSKIKNAINDLDKEVDVTGAMNVGKDYINFVRRANPILVHDTLQLFDAFLKSLLK